MYIEFKHAQTRSFLNTLALDWDETTSDYPLAFQELARRFDRVIIVTVNDELTLDYVCQHLGITPDVTEIHCCPADALENVGQWKAQVCAEQQVALMFDDNPDVVRACHALGVNAICVRERSWKFEK
ncbi:MAG: HAD family hydrolase [Cellvibrionales bacterium]|jgi:peroxiredoxin|nr:HAD family hydrolase [Cellvibrionales bacterium]